MFLKTVFQFNTAFLIYKFSKQSEQIEHVSIIIHRQLSYQMKDKYVGFSLMRVLTISHVK